jgi:hypothetical protein
LRPFITRATFARDRLNPEPERQRAPWNLFTTTDIRFAGVLAPGLMSNALNAPLICTLVIEHAINPS